ncbi:hypothetical protein XENOCAPTIV_012486 [Xenoophorus captivus]|uniref:Uncharacterized protein n=1 Tax=Xenoophorus captivus TaxID=1517983 RepID=A0ABV0S8J9_9TELE
MGNGLSRQHNLRGSQGLEGVLAQAQRTWLKVSSWARSRTRRGTDIGQCWSMLKAWETSLLPICPLRMHTLAAFGRQHGQFAGRSLWLRCTSNKLDFLGTITHIASY